MRTAATGLATLGDAEPPAEAVPTRQSAALQAQGAIKVKASGWPSGSTRFGDAPGASLLLSREQRPAAGTPNPDMFAAASTEGAATSVEGLLAVIEKVEERLQRLRVAARKHMIAPV